MSNGLPQLLECNDLAGMLDDPDILIVDLCSEESWQRGHIPGAVRVTPSEIMLGEKPAPGQLPPIERLNSLISRLGLNPQTLVVSYDDEGGGWAGRFIWTLETIGHQRTAYLNGGILAWRAAGLQETDQITEREPQAQTCSLNETFRASRDYIEQNLGNPDIVIWDARSPAEYSGEKVLAARGGHIPGAINGEWTSLMDLDDHRRFRPDLEAHLAQLGLTRDKEIITHCQTHHRSGLTWLAARLLGYEKIRAYDGSWSEWGNLEDTPIES
jgi:thiosulfate/3-mercaptopyruvate sulfurtransferase